MNYIDLLKVNVNSWDETTQINHATTYLWKTTVKLEKNLIFDALEYNLCLKQWH